MISLAARGSVGGEFLDTCRFVWKSTLNTLAIHEATVLTLVVSILALRLPFIPPLKGVVYSEKIFKIEDFWLANLAPLAPIFF